MKFFPLLFKNLLRRRRRAALTASSVAVCVFILVALVTVTTYMKNIIRETESRLIVITRGRAQPLKPTGRGSSRSTMRSCGSRPRPWRS